MGYRQHKKKIFLVILILSPFLLYFIFFGKKVEPSLENTILTDSIQLSPHQSFADLINAANQGDPKAQYTVGVLIADKGNKLPNDYKMAAILFEKAAEQGLARAQYMLSLLMNSGSIYRKLFINIMPLDPILV